MSRIYNFSAGPATIPEEVLLTVRDELLDWHGRGMSIAEIFHRSKDFVRVAQEAERDLRELVDIPENYHVLFLQGGARLQFAMVPMNLLGHHKQAVYIDSGVWSHLAIEEAKKYCDVHLATHAKELNYTAIPDRNDWHIPSEAAYFYYVDNETVNGIEFPFIPETDLTLVCDMSSNLLTRPFNVSCYGLIFACAQKNVGLAGLTILIIHDDLIKQSPLSTTPSYLQYALHAKENSFVNTPPTFAWYLAGLIFKWIKKQGGITAMAERNQRKSAKFYKFIDQSDFFQNPINPAYRSRMNVIFRLADEKLNSIFLKEATKIGLANLKGHRFLGGMRASIYNAMPEEGVDALINFMQQFEKQNG